MEVAGGWERGGVGGSLGGSWEVVKVVCIGSLCCTDLRIIHTATKEIIAVRISGEMCET